MSFKWGQRGSLNFFTQQLSYLFGGTSKSKWMDSGHWFGAIVAFSTQQSAAGPATFSEESLATQQLITAY